MKRPTYIVFAGVNGAGKSTFYHSGFWKDRHAPLSMKRINPDEILLEMGGDSSSYSDQLKAGKEAARRVRYLFEKRSSFNQETTLTGHISVHNIMRAHEEGYRVILYYIGVTSPDKALERIAHRVETGGHNIASEVVARRYRESLRNLSLVLDYCDEAIVYDNTTEFTAVAQWVKGVLTWVGNIGLCAPWLLEAVFDESVWRSNLR